MAIQKKASNNKVKSALTKERNLPGDSSKSTKKTDDASAEKESVGYIKGSWRELRRVTWPGRKEAWKMTFAVIVFTILFTAYTTGLDFILEKVVRQIFL